MNLQHLQFHAPTRGHCCGTAPRSLPQTTLTTHSPRPVREVANNASKRLQTYLNRKTFTIFLVCLAPQHLIRWSLDEHTYPGVEHVIQSTSPMHSSLSISVLIHSHFPFDSKFPDNPEATHAFQKVSVAYNILSDPASKRVYDSHPASHEFSINTPGATMRAEETLRTVIIGIFNDFLDGDLEMVRTLLSRSHFNYSGSHG